MKRFLVVLLPITLLLVACEPNDPHPSHLIPENSGLTGVIKPSKFVEDNFGSIIAQLSSFSNESNELAEMGIAQMADFYFFTEGEGLLRTRIGAIFKLDDADQLETYLVNNALKLLKGEVNISKLNLHTWMAYTEEHVLMLYSFSGENLEKDLRGRIQHWISKKDMSVSGSKDSIFFNSDQFNIHYQSENLKKQIGFLLENQGFFFLNRLPENDHGVVKLNAIEDTLQLIMDKSISEFEMSSIEAQKNFFSKTFELNNNALVYSGNIKQAEAKAFLQSKDWWTKSADRLWLNSTIGEQLFSIWNGQWLLSKGDDYQKEIIVTTPEFNAADGSYELQRSNLKKSLPSFVLQMGINKGVDVEKELKFLAENYGAKTLEEHLYFIDATPLLGIQNFPDLLAGGLKIYYNEDWIRIASGNISDDVLKMSKNEDFAPHLWRLSSLPNQLQNFSSSPAIQLLLGALQKDFQSVEVKEDDTKKEVLLTAKEEQNAGILLFNLFNGLKKQYLR